MTVTVESVPADRHLEVAEHLERFLAGAQEVLSSAGLGLVREASVSGPAAVETA